ncbi:hypothetical protein J1N35_035559 [Gossypium stocksii]|uniref:Uncharacterized protein n=1 Tax=Gossypium stocksii TaxID=47602 RepID=A0A9D3UUX6_9ROSI|nr:hypothetical protein J1N35_035559 [Gossypium stocksii]
MLMMQFRICLTSLMKGYARPSNLGRNFQIFERMSESRRGQIYRICAALVILLGIWGAVGYAPLLVLRQYWLRQFIPVTEGLTQCEFTYKGDNYKKKVCEISNAWNQTRRMKGFSAGLMTTLGYDWWWGKRINDNIPMPNQENARMIEEHLRVVPSELEIIK